MRQVWTVARRDFSSYFVSPVGFSIIAVFFGLMGWLFSASLAEFQQRSLQYMQYSQMNQFSDLIQPPNLNQLFMNVLANMGVIFLFLAPMITMRLFAEERKTSTLELLFTSPLSTVEIVLGKFVAAVMLFGIVLLLSLVYPTILLLAGNPAIGPILSGYLGVFLMGCAFLALGIFFSSLTESQVVAGALSFGFALFFWIMNWVSANASPKWEAIFSYVSIIPHLTNFIRGLMSLSDVVYYLSFIVFALFLSHRSVISRT